MKQPFSDPLFELTEDDAKKYWLRLKQRYLVQMDDLATKIADIDAILAE